MMFEFLATAPFGLEGVVADELRELGFENVKAQTGGAVFAGDLSDALRANLWLRCADRVLLVVGRFEAKTFDALFEGVKRLPWEQFIAKDAKFPVSGNSARSQLMSVSDCQSITKKAIVERLKQKHRVQTLPEQKETCAVQVALHNDMAVLTLDTSGAGLSRRGYRTWNGEAPIRETLAASILRLSPWRSGRALHDPMCGTGTLLVEAAFMAANRAPGMTREFACETWRWADAKAIAVLREQAKAAFTPQNIEGITGADVDAQALELAKRHIRQAGLSGRIALRQEDVCDYAPDAPGMIVTNPPYGERLSDRKGCESIARALGRLNRSAGQTVCAITAYTGFEKAFGRRADKRRRLYNGRLECEFMTFYGPRRKPE